MENNSYEPDHSHGKSGVPETTPPAFPPPTSSFAGGNRAYPPPPYDTAYPNYYRGDIHTPISSGQPYYPQPGPGYSGPVFVNSQGCEQPQQVPYVGHQVMVAAVPVAHVSMAGAIIFSCITYFFCGVICGGIAFILAMIGQSSSNAGDARGAIQMRNASYGVSIFGIVFGFIIYAVLIGIYASAIASSSHKYRG